MNRYFIGLICLFMVGSSYGHQQKTAVTSVKFNQRLQYIEVMHKFYLHDAEHAVKKLFDPSADILSSAETQQTFAEYVQRHFALKQDNGSSIPLTFVGIEIDGKYLWVYQEKPIPKKLTGLKISNGALHDLWPAQINLVNVEGKGKVKSVLFDSESSWLDVELAD
ncbi:DUF6702 family protein [uncultured Shewanella sp.]|uniref:DUF6702 family protein n=1 Tax=uncultured Shewanella sp. TaxID=173975 RepID=UPI00261D9600|nr:DUF6702 family protein [uncultured Shewanella sp.]